MQKNVTRIKRLLLVVLACVLLATGLAFAEEDRYARGTSLIAADQNIGPSYEGLTIHWLDIGGHVPNMGGPYVFGDESFFYLQFFDEEGSHQMLIDNKGTVVVPPGYDQIEPLSADVFRVGMMMEQPPRKMGELSGPPGYRMSLIDRDGNAVSVAGELNQLGVAHDGLILVYDDNGRLGYVYEAGTVVIPCQYSYAEDFSEGYAVTCDVETGLWGFVGQDGQPLTGHEYIQAESFQEGLALVYREGRYRYLNLQGEEVISLDGVQQANSFHEGLALVRNENGQSGYIDQSGNYAIAPFYGDGDDFSEGVALVTFRNATGEYLSSTLIDKTGNRLVPVGTYSFTFAQGMQNGLIPATLEATGKQGYLNRYGSTATPFAFETAGAFGAGVSLVRNVFDGGVVGLLERPATADVDLGNGIIRVEIDGERVNFADTDPVMDEGRVLVPMRSIFEALGAEVGWEGSTQTVTGTKASVAVKLTLGVNEVEVNGAKLELDVPAHLINGRTMVPVRFVTESFGGEADWIAETNTVKITLRR